MAGDFREILLAEIWRDLLAWEAFEPETLLRMLAFLVHCVDAEFIRGGSTAVDGLVVEVLGRMEVDRGAQGGIAAAARVLRVLLVESAKPVENFARVGRTTIENKGVM